MLPRLPRIPSGSVNRNSRSVNLIELIRNNGSSELIDNIGSQKTIINRDPDHELIEIDDLFLFEYV